MVSNFGSHQTPGKSLPSYALVLALVIASDLRFAELLSSVEDL